MTDRIELAKPDVGAREEELVLEVLRSGRLSLGPVQERFEQAVAGFLGVADAVAVSSGTAALHLGVRQLGWGAGDEVVTSPFSFVASANCLLYEGARPAFCDVDPVTLNLDPGAAAAAVGGATAGILPVHIFGCPAAMAELETLAEANGIGMLEDACEALGARDSGGVAVGARGNLATFAFYANKQITTGEGGMIIPSDPDCAARLRSERNQGRALDMGWLDHDRLGFNYRLSELQAAIGVAQMERAPELLAARDRVAAAYSERLRGLDGAPAGEGDPAGLVLPGSDPIGGKRSWFVYVVRIPAGVDRDGVIAALGAQGVASKAYLPCIHLMPHYRERFGFRDGEFPVAEEASARSLALPFYGSLDEGRIDRVAEALREALGR
ncbi:MAG: perosamine synthetase [Solirubrobacterales bacterium]|jgi:perosamine synthetase|nr:perosamine synthetase [Solirubrobacterales bacterium]